VVCSLRSHPISHDDLPVLLKNLHIVFVVTRGLEKPIQL